MDTSLSKLRNSIQKQWTQIWRTADRRKFIFSTDLDRQFASSLCLAVDLIMSTSPLECWLHSSLTDISQATPSSGSQQYFLQSRCAPVDGCKSSRVYLNVRLKHERVTKMGESIFPALQLLLLYVEWKKIVASTIHFYICECFWNKLFYSFQFDLDVWSDLLPAFRRPERSLCCLGT